MNCMIRKLCQTIRQVKFTNQFPSLLQLAVDCLASSSTLEKPLGRGTPDCENGALEPCSARSSVMTNVAQTRARADPRSESLGELTELAGVDLCPSASGGGERAAHWGVSSVKG